MERDLNLENLSKELDVIVTIKSIFLAISESKEQKYLRST